MLSRGLATTASVLLSQNGGDVGKVVETIGSPLRRPHMDGDRIHEYFGSRREVEGAEMLEKITRAGVPVGIRSGAIYLGSSCAETIGVLISTGRRF